MSFFTVLTESGQAKLAQVLALGQTLDLTTIAIGDNNGIPLTPNESMTALNNEVYRGGIQSLKVDPENSNWLIAEMVIPIAEGGWTIREIMAIDTDGDVFAVGNFPETYKATLAQGSGSELIIRMYFQVANTAAVTLVIDPSISFATRDWVVTQFATKNWVQNELAKIIDDEETSEDKTYSSEKIIELFSQFIDDENKDSTTSYSSEKITELLSNYLGKDSTAKDSQKLGGNSLEEILSQIPTSSLFSRGLWL